MTSLIDLKSKNNKRRQCCCQTSALDVLIGVVRVRSQRVHHHQLLLHDAAADHDLIEVENKIGFFNFFKVLLLKRALTIKCRFRRKKSGKNDVTALDGMGLRFYAATDHDHKYKRAWPRRGG